MAKRELALECDYAYEARSQAQFRALVRGDPDLRDVVSVPDVVGELCTRHLLTTEWVPGAHIDKVEAPSATAGGAGASWRRTLVVVLQFCEVACKHGCVSTQRRPGPVLCPAQPTTHDK